MNETIEAGELAKQIQRELGSYSQRVTDAIKIQVDEIATETVEDLKAANPKRTGDYAKGWMKATRHENTRTKRNTVYNKKHYQLTHLLEYGHARRGGGRVAAKEHIAPVESSTIKRLTKAIEEAAKG